MEPTSPKKLDAREGIQISKEIFSMLREAIIVMLFLFLILFPEQFKAQLGRIGFSKFNFMGMDMDLSKQFKETAESGKQVSDLQLQLASLQAMIDTMRNKNDNPVLKKTFDSIADKTSRLSATTMTLNNKLKQQMSIQQDVLAEKEDIKIADDGWIYAGKLTQDSSGWDLSVRPTIKERKTQFKDGEKITIIDDVYLRRNTTSQNHANADIISVIKEGEQVIYEDRNLSHAISGGWFLWLRVRRDS